MHSVFILIFISFLLVACGGGGTEDSNESNDEGILISSSSSSSTQFVDYDSLKYIPDDDSPLMLVNENKLIKHIKNGIRLELKYGKLFRADEIDYSQGIDIAQYESAYRPPAARGEVFLDPSVHSSDTQEGDITQYDGSYWYVSRLARFNYEDWFSWRSLVYNDYLLPGIQVVKTDVNTQEVHVVSEITFDDELWGSATELYLVGQEETTNYVATIRNIWGDVTPNLRKLDTHRGDEYYTDSPGPRNSTTRIDLIDVKNPSRPEFEWKIEIDGSLIKSKKVGDVLYLATRFEPWLGGLHHESGNESVRAENESRIQSINNTELLPSFRFNEDDKQPLSTQCLLQDTAQDFHGFRSLLHITAINLASQTLVSSQCLSVGLSTMYWSDAAMYFTDSIGKNYTGHTVIHKFSFTDDGINYSATGKVVGTVESNAHREGQYVNRYDYLLDYDRSATEFYLDEYRDNLRIITTSMFPSINLDQIKANPNFFELEEINGALEVVSFLPNTDSPQRIGYSIDTIRFEGVRAYINSGSLIFPYREWTILDLSDSLNPKIMSDVETSDKRSYIHPIDDNYILKLEKDSDNYKMKLQIIDVSEPTWHVIQTKIIEGNALDTYQNLHGLSFLRASQDQLRVAIPVLKAGVDIASGSFEWQYDGLQLLEVNGLSGAQPSMKDAGVLISNNTQSDMLKWIPYSHRSVLDGDAVFFTYFDKFWSAPWNAPEQAQGPTVLENVVCTAEVKFGLRVVVTLNAQETDSVCNAVVTAIDEDFQEVLQAGVSQDDNKCMYFGVSERAGRYDVELAQHGFEIQTSDKVDVWRDNCHVKQTTIQFDLMEQ